MDNVFLKKAETSKHAYAGLPLMHLVGVRPKSGEIGIEIEVEGNKFPKAAGYEINEGDHNKIPKAWKYTQDGSLRGEDNAEYVLAKPILFDEVPTAVTDLWKMFQDYGTVLTESNRTSVHVHLNVQNFYLNRLCSFMAMYFVVEELLTEWCGDHRVGNLFCLRGKDAPAIISRLKEFFRQDGYGYEFSSGMHYAGLNPSAIHKFGSVEIRSLRGVNDPSIIIDWVGILQRLYVLSEEFKDPREVVSGFSGQGPIAWLQGILGDRFSTVMNNTPHTTEEVRDILYDGIRLAQDLCYCRDWFEYKEVKAEENPFGRKPTFASPSIGNTIDMSVGTSTSTPTGTYFSAESTPTGTYYSSEDLMARVQELFQSGHISLAIYEQLITFSPTQIYNYLYGAGYLSVAGTISAAPTPPEPDDYYDEPEDYYDEEEDDE